MKQVHWVWKPAAVVVCLIALGGLALGLFRPTRLYFCVAGAFAFASLGTLQYAFGTGWVPKLVWRIFGPLFSLAMIWPMTTAIGWQATRLAIRPLSGPQQVGTLAAIFLLTSYTLAIVVPLYRLGEWGRAGRHRREQRLSELQDTFA